MKKLFLFTLLSFCTYWAEAIPSTVPYTTTSAIAGTRTVTIGSTSGAISPSGVGCFFAGPGHGYKISGGAGSIRYDFNLPVELVFFEVTNIDGAEDITFKVNGSPACPASINRFPCSGFARAVYGGSSFCDMVAAAGGVNSEGTAGFFNCSGISSIEIIYSGGGATGTIDFDVVIDPGYANAINTFEGKNYICVGQTLALTADADPSGSWSITSSAVTLAVTGALTANATAMSPGTAVITYSIPGGCSVTFSMSVNAAPVAIPVAPLPAYACLSGTGPGMTINLASPPLSGLTYVLWQNSIVTGSYIIGPGSTTFPGTFTCTQTSLTGPAPDVFKVFVVDPATNCSDVSPGTSVTGLPDITGIPTMYLCTIPTTTVLTTNDPSGTGTWSISTAAPSLIGISPTVGTSTTVTATGPSWGTVYYTETTTGNNCTNLMVVGANACKPGNGSTPVTAAPITEFKAYPNPTTGILTLEAPGHGVFTIYGMDGRSLREYAVPEGTSAISMPAPLPAGIYTGQFKAKDGTMTTTHINYKPE